MMTKLKQGCRWLVLWLSDPRTAAMAATTFLSLLWFVVDWSTDTTFRSMSDWMLYACNLLLTMILLTPWMLTRRVWVQLLTIAVADGFCMANLMYNRTYLTAIPADSYAMVSNLADFTSSVTDSLRWKDGVFLIILAAGGVFAYRSRVKEVAGAISRWLSVTAILALITGIGLLSRGGFYQAYDKLVQSCYHYTCGVPTYTIAGHVIYNIMDNNRHAVLDESDRTRVEAWLERHRSLQTLPPDSLKGRRNLVLIICESLESWPIGKSVAGKPITPYLNSLVADSATLYAPNMLTQVAAGHSIDAQLLFTAGMLPATSGIYSMKYPSHHYPTLNMALKEDRGARSMLLTSDKLMTWNMGTIARTFGYDTLLYRDNWEMDQTIDRHLTDGSFLRQVAKVFKRGELWPHGQPAMVTLLTYTGHNPFMLTDDLRDPEFEKGLASLPRRLRDYIAVTHYVDAQLHIMVDYLRSRPDADSTLIVIVGDHEALGSSRDELRGSSKMATELVSPGKFTPFIVLNSPVGGRVDALMGQVDVYTTLLDMLGVRETRWRGMGRSLLDPHRVNAEYTSVPHQLHGDTVGVDPRLIQHMDSAAAVSSRLIIHNMLAP